MRAVCARLLLAIQYDRRLGQMENSKLKQLAGTIFAGGALLLGTESAILAQSAAQVSKTTSKSTGPSAVLSKEWPTYGHDPGGMRFSPLTEITPTNAPKLKVAWTYHMKPAGAPTPPATPPRPVDLPAGRGAAPVGDDPDAPRGGRGRGRGNASGFAPSGATPLVVDGVMYLTTPYQRVVALDSTTGKEIWAFKLPAGNPATRGAEYWPGSSTTPAQIVFGTRTGLIYSVDAKTGKPNMAFGDNGVVNMNTEDITHGLPATANGLSAPPIVYKNLMIAGGTTQENPPQGPAGDVRAWDMNTGKVVWKFRSIPQEGEKGNETWAKDSWKNRTGVNIWGHITIDAQRGIAYLPFGAPSVDQYGGDRAGDNLYGTSLVAVDANTGKYLWHFQVVHHDIWDYDMTGAPALLDVKRNGKTIPAVAAINKVGLLFLLDRVTGKPIYGVEERPVAQSEVPLERTSKTQPFPLKPPPLARMAMTADEVATVTPELEAACRKLMDGLQLGGPYLPVSYNRMRVQFPGNHGGVNWFGTSFNPQLGYLFINSNDLGQISGLKDHDPASGSVARARGQGNRVDPAGPYDGIGGGRFSIADEKSPQQQQLPCQQPPWGTLTAVNVNTGEFAWRVPLGVTDSLPPGKQNTGRPGNGGTIATAGGLVFVGATDDARFRAFDAKTGKEVWTYQLKGAAQATPITFQGKDGRQYVVITATGGGFFNNPVTDDSVIAFALDNAK
ncbi:MAG: Quinoprotein glucose dehydrogenase [Bryobacterales bacterium]|nr:Quinoprotein glucose dehydrogenase [Bryobacterales bacterium]